VTFRQVGAISEYIRGLQAKFWRSDSYVSSRIITKVVPLEEGEISLMPVEDGVEYNFQLRYIKTNNTVGPWTEVQTHTVEGRVYTPDPLDPANLRIVNNPVSPGTKLDLTFAACIVMSSSGNTYPVPAQNHTNNSAIIGVNGMDEGDGVLDGATPYYLFEIANPTLELFGSLLSLSSTDPVMPEGYTHKQLLTALITTPVILTIPPTPSSWYPVTILGREIYYHQISGGYSDTAAQNWVTYHLGLWVPPTSNKAWISLKINCRTETDVAVRRKLAPDEIGGPAEIQFTAQPGEAQAEGWVSLDSSQRIELYIENNVNQWSLIVMGYRLTNTSPGP
jgi:hypothetical protein